MGVYRHSHTPFSSPLSICRRTPTRRASALRVMAAGGDDVKQWPKQDKRRFLHAVYRVGDLDATIDYYKKHFGMKQLRYRDVPDVSPIPDAQTPDRQEAYRARMLPHSTAI